MWYFFDTPQKDGIVYLDGSYDKMAKLFFSESASSELDNIVFNASSKGEISPGILQKTDFLKNARFGGIPIFSERFKEKMSKYLANQVCFYPCCVTVDNEQSTFFLCRIKNVVPIIDYENSAFRILTDGSQILDDPIVIKDDIEEALLIVQDTMYPSVIVVSDLFKKFAEKEGMNIIFYRVDDSFW